MILRHSPMAKPWVVAGGLACVGVVLLARCGGDEEQATPSTMSGVGGATTTSSTTTSDAGATGGGADAGCPPQPAPSYVPDGWVEFPDWSCDCRLYMPGSPDVMPAPIEWEPCDGGQAFDCEAMVTEWEMSNTPAASQSFDRADDGSAILAFRRNMTNHFLVLVAPADGPILRAVLIPRTKVYPGCTINEADIADGRWLLGIVGDDVSGDAVTSDHDGALAGGLDDTALSVLAHYVDEYNYDWAISETWVVRFDTASRLFALPWDMSTEIAVTAPSLDPEGLPTVQPLVQGEAVFWASSNSTQKGINVWTEATGARPFVRWIGDATRGARNLGTDGFDLVWSYGEGKAPNDNEYPVREVWTAPYTTDPDALEPRRLRSQVSLVQTLGVARWEVGCGHAARPSGGADVIQVVRLSDGWSWIVDNVQPAMTLGDVVGLTCDELYASASVGGSWKIVRLRLDSLGPGIAPD